MSTKIIFIISIAIFIASCTVAGLTQYDKEIYSFRKKYKKDFLKEERSPLKRKDLKFLDFYPPDANYRVNAFYKLFKNHDTLDFKTSAGRIKQFLPYAQLYFDLSSVKCSLIVYKSMQLANDKNYANYLFLPFTDMTNGDETYGGGRYLDMDIRDFKKDSVILDFNKVYNPYCAFTTGYNCPVPPLENDLKVEIRAGEKKYKKENH